MQSPGVLALDDQCSPLDTHRVLVLDSQCSPLDTQGCWTLTQSPGHTGVLALDIITWTHRGVSPWQPVQSPGNPTGVLALDSQCSPLDTHRVLALDSQYSPLDTQECWPLTAMAWC